MIDELKHHSPTDDNDDPNHITAQKTHPLSGYNSSGSSQTNLSSISHTHSVKHFSTIHPRSANDHNLHTPTTLNPSYRSLMRSVEFKDIMNVSEKRFYQIEPYTNSQVYVAMQAKWNTVHFILASICVDYTAINRILIILRNIPFILMQALLL